MDVRTYEGIARWTYDQFLLRQPQVPVEGLFFAGASFVIVCPTLHKEVTGAGRPLREWFDHSCRPAAMPIYISDCRPKEAEEVRLRSPGETAEGVGEPRRLVDLFRDLALVLPKAFPLVGIDEDSDANVAVLVSRDLAKEEHDDELRVTTNGESSDTYAAELEREKTSQRTREHLMTKARRGLNVGGRCFGYDNQEVKDGERRKEVRYVVNEAQAVIVREVFARYGKGEGLRSIVRDLNSRAVPSPRGNRRLV